MLEALCDHVLLTLRIICIHVAGCNWPHCCLAGLQLSNYLELVQVVDDSIQSFLEVQVLRLVEGAT